MVMKVRARSSAALRALAFGAACARADTAVCEIDVIRCPGKSASRICRREPNWASHCDTGNGRFRKRGKGVLSSPPPVGTSCSAKGYIGGFNAGGGRQAGGFSVTLLKWALIFLVISIIAGILGFTGISAASADIARFLFYVFVVIFLVLLILGLTIFRA
jgi:uncharacterized membrane protein YtjA (UPF0391 family)